MANLDWDTTNFELPFIQGGILNKSEISGFGLHLDIPVGNRVLASLQPLKYQFP